MTPQEQQQQTLKNWQQQNPELFKLCQQAAEPLGEIQRAFLGRLAQYVVDNGESIVESEFSMNEFLDQYGQRFAQLQGIVQGLSILATPIP